MPIHSVKSDNFDTYFQNAVKSVLNNKVLPSGIMFVAPPDVIEHVVVLLNDKSSGYTIPSKDFKIEFITNKSGDTGFATQMNMGVESVTTEFFSFLEFDDEYSNIWFSNVEKYMAEYPEISVFLPMISDTNSDKKFLGYSNEIAWAYEFTDKHGIIDAETLKEYPNFNPDGMVMKVSDYLRIGGYKKNIKLTFNLEFLLRACDQALQVMVIPKIGYTHINMRTDSLFWDYKNGDNKLTPEESEFWMEQARKEFYYADDREIIVPKALVDELIQNHEHRS